MATPFLASTRIRQNGLFQKYGRLARLADIRQTPRHLPNRFEMYRQTCWHSPSLFARTRQTSQYLPNAIFGKNVTCLAKFARVLSNSGKCGVIRECLVLIKRCCCTYFYNLIWTITFINNQTKLLFRFCFVHF